MEICRPLCRYTISGSLARLAGSGARRARPIPFSWCMDTFETFPTSVSVLGSLLLAFADHLQVPSLKMTIKALNILNSKLTLNKSMADLNITDTGMFGVWLEEEWTYLKELSKELIHEMQEMEYYQKLVNLSASKWVLYLLLAWIG